MTPHLRANSFAAVILFAVVALSPLPLGSTMPVFIAIECGLLGLAAITLTFRNAQNVHVALLLGLALVPLAYGIVLHEQLAEHPWFGEAFSSPWWERASAALSEPLPPVRSILRDQPWFALGAPLAASLALALSLIVCADRFWARRLMDLVFWVGTAYALFAIVSFFADPTHILTFEKFGYRDVLTGTFINRNTAAVYFGSCVVLSVVRGIRAATERTSSGRIRLPIRALPAIPRSALMPASFGLINLIAMFLTASRAGIVLSGFAAIVAAGLMLRSRLANARAVLTVPAIAVVGGLFLVMIAGGVTNRFLMQGTDDGGRAEIYAATWRMVKENWAFGTGLGTFRWGFSPYRPDDLPIWGMWDKAHNVLLEIAAEAGLPLALLVLVAALTILVLLVRGSLVRRMDRDIPIAALGVAIIGFSHAILDFSLQIPGFAITAFAVMGAGLAQSFSSAPGAGIPRMR